MFFLPRAIARRPVSRFHKIPESASVRLLLAGSIRQGCKLPPGNRSGATFSAKSGQKENKSALYVPFTERDGKKNVLVPCSVYVVLLPHGFHHLAGKPARDFSAVKSVVRAVAIRP